jgi:hypothetical protein
MKHRVLLLRFSLATAIVASVGTSGHAQSGSSQCDPATEKVGWVEHNGNENVVHCVCKDDGVERDAQGVCVVPLGVAKRPWKELLNWLPPEAWLNSQRQARNRDPVPFRVQRIEDAIGNKVNFDLYGITISRLPTFAHNDPNFFLQFVRKNLNIFLAASAGQMRGLSQGDDADWQGRDAAPIGAVMIWKIPGWNIPGTTWIHEEAAVVTSRSSPTTWTFTPVHIGVCCPGDHPISGNREFGIQPIGNGSYRVYTRAVDRALRPTDYFDAKLAPSEDIVFNGADKLWRSFQSNLAEYVNQRGGSAAVDKPIINRHSLNAVEASGLFERPH